MTVPFVYPVAPHVRRHGPQGYADYESYRPWLRDEFAFRCVYCLLREQWGPFKGVYALDQFLPIAQHPVLALHYDNLLYSCTACNLSKGAQSTPDPLQVLLALDVSVTKEGQLQATTVLAQKLIELLSLNRPRLCEFRAVWVRIVRLATLHDPELRTQLLGYPTELPDLATLRPPTGNTRPAGLAQAYRARQQRGELPDHY